MRRLRAPERPEQVRAQRRRIAHIICAHRLTIADQPAGQVIPAIGEDMGYLVWRKRNCCAL